VDDHAGTVLVLVAVTARSVDPSRASNDVAPQREKKIVRSEQNRAPEQ